MARGFLGEWWLIGFCNASAEMQGQVAVSAYATDLRIVDGQIIFSVNARSELGDSGVPATWQAAVPCSPEGTVAAAFERTQRRAIEVPWLLRQAQFPPTVSKWRVRLEAPMELRGAFTGHRYQTAEVDVGLFLIGELGSNSVHYKAGVGVAAIEPPDPISFGLRIAADGAGLG